MPENMIGIDFDDTIYCTEKRKEIPGAIEAIRTLRRQGYNPYIFTANPNHDFILNRLNQKGIDDIIVTSQKIHAKYYIDDRALPFITTWDDILKKIIK